MGRKNRNARPYRGAQVYSSFQEAEVTLKPVDLSNIEWAKKSRTRAPQGYLGDFDAYVSIVKNSSSGSLRTMALSVVIKMKYKKILGEYVTYALIDTGREKRLYFKSTDSREGYKSCNRNSKKSFSIRFPLFKEDVCSFEEFTGCHDLQYDTSNDVYYITEQ